eukprot:6491951-Amphidinium_carterae.1
MVICMMFIIPWSAFRDVNKHVVKLLLKDILRDIAQLAVGRICYALQVALDDAAPLTVCQDDEAGPLCDGGRCWWWKVCEICKPEVPKRLGSLHVEYGTDDLVGAL